MIQKTFYEERDSRTLKITEKTDYRNKRVLVAVDGEIARTFNGQIMAMTSLNLLSRFCRNISFLCDDDVKTVFIPRKFHDQNFPSALLHMLRNIDSFGNFRLVDTDEGNYDEILAVGDPRLSQSPDFGIDSDGWLSYLNKGRMAPPLKKRRSNPLGASASACIATGEIFKNMLRMNTGIEGNLCFSAFDYSIDSIKPINPDLPGSIDLGYVQVVGCGALGSAVGFFLSMLPVKGRMTLIDYDRVELSNLNRYPTFTAHDVGKMKVDALTDFLSGTRIEIDPFLGKYSEFVGKHGAGYPDMVLSLVDRNGPRHEIQMNMPSLILYAATGEWTFSIGRHQALEDDCHICRFPDVERDDGECATVSITPDISPQVREEFAASVSFVSSTAALFLVSELLKIRLFGRSPTKNFLQLDMSMPLRTIRQHQRRRSEGCVCTETWFQEAYRRRLNFRRKDRDSLWLH